MEEVLERSEKKTSFRKAESPDETALPIKAQ